MFSLQIKCSFWTGRKNKVNSIFFFIWCLKWFLLINNSTKYNMLNYNAFLLRNPPKKLKKLHSFPHWTWWTGSETLFLWIRISNYWFEYFGDLLSDRCFHAGDYYSRISSNCRPLHHLLFNILFGPDCNLMVHTSREGRIQMWTQPWEV